VAREHNPLDPPAASAGACCGGATHRYGSLAVYRYACVAYVALWLPLQLRACAPFEIWLPVGHSVQDVQKRQGKLSRVLERACPLSWGTVCRTLCWTVAMHMCTCVSYTHTPTVPVLQHTYCLCGVARHTQSGGLVTPAAAVAEFQHHTCPG
jgi:hypothetical protein